MRRISALLLISSLAFAPAACREQPQGTMKAIVIGGEPKLRDPALGPLPPEDAVLLQNVAQGLVRFDASGNIIGGLAERWNVSDDGLSYIFRLAPMQWPNGKKITAEQIVRLLKRQVAPQSRNDLKDSLGAIEDIVAMTDRVIEIQLEAPRPNLLSLLAQPQLSILRGRDGTGPFKGAPTAGPGGELRLSRQVTADDDEQSQRQFVLLSGATAANAIGAFAVDKADLVLGGTFIDLALTRRVKLRRGALRFDPASGLFGLVPTHSGGSTGDPEARLLLSEALDRANFVAALGVTGLTPRATLLQPGLDGIGAPAAPAWLATPSTDRLPELRQRAERLFGSQKPVVRVALPEGPGADLLFAELVRDWGALGLVVERAHAPLAADFALVDAVAPSASPAWFVRSFRCEVAAVCDAQADTLAEAARQTPIPAQRYALLAQAATRIDQMQLFIPITAPVRWSLVSQRVQGFAGNRYARHTLTDLEQQAGKD